MTCPMSSLWRLLHAVIIASGLAIFTTMPYLVVSSISPFLKKVKKTIIAGYPRENRPW